MKLIVSIFLFNIEMNSILSLHTLDKVLPTNFVRLPLLSHFDIGFNGIKGSLPMLQNVTRLAMYDNSFSGSIPTEYGLLENLTDLDLHDNCGITGTVPTELMECNKLTLISLHNTRISGNVTFCDGFEKDIVVIVTDVSIYGEECKCCCTTR